MNHAPIHPSPSSPACRDEGVSDGVPALTDRPSAFKHLMGGNAYFYPSPNESQVLQPHEFQKILAEERECGASMLTDMQILNPAEFESFLNNETNVFKRDAPFDLDLDLDFNIDNVKKSCSFLNNDTLTEMEDIPESPVKKKENGIQEDTLSNFLENNLNLRMPFFVGPPQRASNEAGREAEENNLDFRIPLFVEPQIQKRSKEAAGKTEEGNHSWTVTSVLTADALPPGSPTLKLPTEPTPSGSPPLKLSYSHATASSRQCLFKSQSGCNDESGTKPKFQVEGEINNQECKDILTPENNYGYKGRMKVYSKQERARVVNRYREKRSRRCFKKRIRYNCRSNFAVNRPRVGGRFTKLKTS